MPVDLHPIALRTVLIVSMTAVAAAVKAPSVFGTRNGLMLIVGVVPESSAQPEVIQRMGPGEIADGFRFAPDPVRVFLL